MISAHELSNKYWSSKNKLLFLAIWHNFPEDILNKIATTVVDENYFALEFNVLILACHRGNLPALKILHAHKINLQNVELKYKTVQPWKVVVKSVELDKSKKKSCLNSGSVKKSRMS